MTKAEMEQYKNKKPVAVYPMGNWGGIEILDIVYGSDDHVIYRYNYGQAEDVIHKAKITYKNDNAYFRVGDFKIKLDECMRV